MTRDALHVRRLKLVRAPGFPAGGFEITDLAPGVNIVHGPNASGKTTLARTVQDLLWPRRDAASTSAVGRVALDGDDWRIDLDGGRASYQRDGAPADAPPLPPPDHRDRYTLALHDLLQVHTRDPDLAEAVLRESAGGYDLAAAAEAIGARDRPSTSGTTVAKDARAAVEVWREAEDGVQDLLDDRRRLAALERRLARARAARTRAAVLAVAIERDEARASLDAARERLEALPETLARVGGHELKTVQDLAKDAEDATERLTDARRRIDEARAAIEAAGLPDGGVRDHVLGQLDEQLANARAVEDDLRQHRLARADAVERRDKARAEIGGAVEDDQLDRLDPPTWNEVAAVARRAEELRAERAQARAVQLWLGSGDDDTPDAEALNDGRRALESWLQSPAPASPTNGHRLVPVVSAVAVAGSAGLLGWFVHPALYALVLLALGLLWLGLRSDPATPASDHRRIHRSAYERTGLEPPSQWTGDAIGRRLDDLYAGLAEARLVRERLDRWEARVPDVEAIEAGLREVSAELDRLRDRLGVPADASGPSLVAVAGAVQRWREADADVARADARIAEARDALDHELDAIDAVLTDHGYDPADDAAAASGRIKALQERNREHARATAELDRARRDEEEAGTRVADLERRIERVYAELDLKAGDESALRSLLDRKEDHDERVRAVDKAQSHFEGVDQRLRHHAGFDETLLDADLATLHEELGAAQTEAEAYDDLLTERTRIEADLDRARSSHAVEDALANKERALDALADQLADDQAAMVARVLVDHVRERAGDVGRPPVFDAARRVLSEITQHRYRLDVEEGERATFRAYDTVEERGLALDELSSATRLQVLLAARIAFIEQQERDVQLPIVLDETLANTDDVKAHAIIDAAIGLARAGRQVFYLTAQGDEVGKWLAALDGADDVSHAVIDLAEVRDLSRRVDVPTIERAAVPTAEPPRPGDMDHAAYGDALDAPPVDIRRGAAAAHVWYVVDDPEVLHHVLSMGVEHWGQLREMMDAGSADLVSDDPGVVGRIRRSAAALDEHIRSARVGRGRPVDGAVLRASGAVSDTFIDDVRALAEAVGGDAERIIAALRDGKVSRFQTSKTDELEAFFEEHGYIDPAGELSAEDRRLRMLGRLGRDGVDANEARWIVDAVLERIEQRRTA